MEFISEPITPQPGTADAAVMARGEAGLPRSFSWRGQRYEVAAVLEAWKSTAREGGSGEVYLRRHWFKIQTQTGETMTLYGLRQAKRNQPRWWLYEMSHI